MIDCSLGQSIILQNFQKQHQQNNLYYKIQQINRQINNPLLKLFIKKLILNQQIPMTQSTFIQPGGSQSYNPPKIQCAFHPQEFITNFCVSDCCLLPLCPSCIKIHTNEHINLKNVNPQYEPINQLIKQINEELGYQAERCSSAYKSITQVDAKINTFRNAIQQKIVNLKNSIISETQKYFVNLDQEVTNKINSISYIRILSEYKQQTKKSIIGLKNIEKGLHTENSKLMRLIIKYKGDNVMQEMERYFARITQFMDQINTNFITFSIKEDYKDQLCGLFDNIHKVDISDFNTHTQVSDIFHKLKKVYEKETDGDSKKEIRKSLESFLGNNNSKKSYHFENSANKQKHQKNHSTYNQQNSFISYDEKIETYNSVSSQMQNQQYLTLGSKQKVSHHTTPVKNGKQHQYNKRSLSRGKGLSLMQMNNTYIDRENPHFAFQNKSKKIGCLRAVDIAQPTQFSRSLSNTIAIKKS